MGDGSGVIAAVAGIQHDDASGQTVARASDELSFAQGVRRSPGHRPGEVGEGPQGLGTQAAIDGQSHPALEASDRPLRVGTEHAVDPVGGEPEGQEALLQLGHVVALQQMAGGVGEQAVAQLPAGPVEGDVGLGSDHAVDHQTSPLLECSHRAGQLLVVHI